MWQPIETAPKDGRDVDLWVIFDNGEQGRASNSSYEFGRWWSDYCGQLHSSNSDFTPTHWMPLPPPPTSV